jgi:hypothetical protein
MKRIVALRVFVALILLWVVAGGSISLAQEPGVGDGTPAGSPLAADSIAPVVAAVGLVSLSVDAVGTVDPNGAIVQVEKPSGATVRAAYLAAASTGWSYRVLVDGDVKIDGASVTWDGTKTTPSLGVNCYNHWADVTALVKPKIDAAPAGRVDLLITEVSTLGIDGEVLAVIFDDPNQTAINTIVLLFGAQDVSGDTFAIALADPIDLGDLNLVLDLSLGISFGFQGEPSGQARLTSTETA